MNWDALSAIGELLGATGVVVTLIYLSVQIRQNTRAIRGSTLNVLTGHHVHELRWSHGLRWSVTGARLAAGTHDRPVLPRSRTASR